MLLKNPVTPPGIDPGTVRLVAQRLNNYATPGPIKHVMVLRKYKEKHFFCGHNFLTESVFVTQLYVKAVMSV